MNFLRGCKTVIFALILVLSFLPILGAQSGPSVEAGVESLPESRDLHFPESSLSKATIGTLSGDGDSFMSPVDWSSIENMEKTFILGGVDEHGLVLGFARKFGNTYLGLSYSGDLIDEIYRRIVNKEQNHLSMVNEKDEGNNKLSSKLVVGEDDEPAGSVVSSNDINLIVGTGPFGLRLGFAQWIKSVESYTQAPYWAFEESLETSLKPNLEMGLRIGAGNVTIKPSFRAALDIHQFKATKGDLKPDENSLSGTSPAIYWVIQDNQINFLEPSAGLGIALEFALSDSASMEFALDGDAAFRIYPDSGDPDAITSILEYAKLEKGYPALPLVHGSSGSTYATGDGSGINSGDITKTAITSTIPLDLRATVAPSFSFSGDISERFTMGASIAINGGFNILTIENTASGSTTTATHISAAPDLALGGSFHLIPDHFSLHAGIGVELFSINISSASSEAGGSSNKTVTRFSLPTARFGGGLTINLTKSLAVDAMAFSSGLDFDTTKFNLLLTIKK